MAEVKDDPIVDKPTYLGNVRYFFTAEDIDHMGSKGIDLGTYGGVKAHAVQIYGAVSAGQMPPDPAPKWSANRSQTFLNWMTNGYPMGAAPAAFALARVAAASPQRIRKNAASLSANELALLSKAFSGVMARDPDDPTGYFMLAGQHGLPNLYCQHHVDAFNPWHRVYLRNFEDQLRSIEGCADVTLPYWDISTPIPAFLSQPPFASYAMPRAVGDYAQGQATQRSSQAAIDASLARFSFFSDFNKALVTPRWGKYVDTGTGAVGTGFQQYSISAHDAGHSSVGPTMAIQEYASYDPIFWLYHCNLDRHWLSWQTHMHAVDWASFQALLDSTQFWKPPLNPMQPFTVTTDQTIAFDIGYDQLIAVAAPFDLALHRIDAGAQFKLVDDDMVNVSVEGIQRLKIPGTFAVDLLADGIRIASRAFFQPNDPPGCPNCATVPLVGVQMDVQRADIVGKMLSIRIEVPGQEEIGAQFPLSVAGNPTIRVSALLSPQ